MPLKRQAQKKYFFEKPCKFIGSLAISLLKGNERQAFVNEKLLEMKDVGKGISVVLLVNEEGIKVLKDNKLSVKMAHGITKVLFSTCHPDQKLFAYVVRIPTVNGKMITQAHMFRTNKSKHTQELSSSISKAFKIAYQKTTLRRQNKVDQFEQEAENNKEKINAQKKRWAKGELAHGHDNAAHALRARGYQSTRNDEPPSGGIQKLVDSLENENKFKESHQQRRENLNSQNSTDLPVRKISSSAKILPMSEEEFDVNQEQPAPPISSSQKFPLGDVFTTTQTVQQQETDFDLRKVSQESTPLDDWDIVRGQSDNHNISVSNFVFPAPIFGAIDEHRPAASKGSPSIAKPISRFGYVPESDEEEWVAESDDQEDGDELVDWEYTNISQKMSDPPVVPEPRDEEVSKETRGVELVTESEEASIEAMNKVVEQPEAASKDEVSTPEASRSNNNGHVKKRSRKKRHQPSINRMTLSEEQILKDSEWYQPGFSRSIAEEILQNRPNGSFFLRDSTSHPGSFVMTMRVSKVVKESQVMNYLIVQDRDGLYRIKGFSNIFPGLTYLVAHYSSIEEDIPCRLFLYNDNPLFANEDNGVDEKDGKVQEDLINLDYLLDDNCDDQDYINFSSNADICRELEEFCFQ